MVWGCISCNGIGPFTKVKGTMNGKDYRLLFGHLLPYSSQWDLVMCLRMTMPYGIDPRQ